MKKRLAAIFLALLMTVTVIDVAQPVNVKAEDFYTAKSGVTITADSKKVKGYIPKGEKTFVVNMVVDGHQDVNLVPYVHYNHSKDEAYNKKIQDLKTKVRIYNKDGKKQMGYYKVSSDGDFGGMPVRTGEVSIPNYANSNTAYTMWAKYLLKGTYKVVYTLPEEVTEGAKIELYHLYMEREKDDVYVLPNTKETAKTIRAGNKDDFPKTRNYAVTYGRKQEYWYKIVSAGKREFDYWIDGFSYSVPEIGKMQLYDKNGKLIKQKVLKGNIENDFGDMLEDGMPQYFKRVNDSVVLNKGTYYIKFSAMSEKTDGNLDISFYLNRAEKPKVTSCKAYTGVIKGTAEAGSKVYAKVNGKTYKAAKKTSAKGNFSIRIPKVKAGTKIRVYLIDADGRKGDKSRTVKVTK